MRYTLKAVLKVRDSFNFDHAPTSAEAQIRASYISICDLFLEPTNVNNLINFYIAFTTISEFP